MYYYTYCIIFKQGTLKDKKYYGRRKSRCKPEKDVKYIGSGVIPHAYFKKFKPTPESYEKIILGIYKTFDDLVDAEQQLLDEHVGKPYCVNFNSNAYGGGCNIGRISIYKNRETYYIQPEKLEYYLSLGFTLGRPKGQIPWNKGLVGVQQAWNKGIKASEESKNKLSESLKGNKYALGCKHSKESIEQAAEKIRGRICINNGIEDKVIDPDQLDAYIKLGYKKGRLFRCNEDQLSRMSQKLKGRTNWLVGKNMPEWCKKNLSDKLKDTKLMTDGNINRYIKNEDIETYKANGWKILETHKDTKAMNNGIITKFVKYENCLDYEKMGWKYGILRNKKKE